jgi:hypothetical protein
MLYTKKLRNLYLNFLFRVILLFENENIICIGFHWIFSLFFVFFESRVYFCLSQNVYIFKLTINTHTHYIFNDSKKYFKKNYFISSKKSISVFINLLKSKL